MSKDVRERRKAPLQTPTDLGDNARRDIAGALNALLAQTLRKSEIFAHVQTHLKPVYQG